MGKSTCIYNQLSIRVGTLNRGFSLHGIVRYLVQIWWIGSEWHAGNPRRRLPLERFALLVKLRWNRPLSHASACSVQQRVCKKPHLCVSLPLQISFTCGCVRCVDTVDVWMRSTCGFGRHVAAVDVWLRSTFGCSRRVAAVDVWLRLTCGYSRLVLLWGVA